MSIEAWIALIIILVVVLYFKFDISPIGLIESVQTHKNGKDLIKKIFELAEKQGGFWRIDFNKNSGRTFSGFTIYSQNGTHKCYTFNELGYSDINSFTNYEFLKLLKKETERRKGYYHPVVRTSGGATGSYVTVDGGCSYHMEYDTVDSIDEIYLYSYEYYQKYKPYNSSKKSHSNYKKV